MNIHIQPPKVTAAERVRWLAEVSETLTRARELIGSLDPACGQSPEILDLHLRIESALFESQLLRLGHLPRDWDQEWDGPWGPINARRC